MVMKESLESIEIEFTVPSMDIVGDPIYMA